MKRIILWLRQALCRHSFRLDDLTQTGIAMPEPPDRNASYHEWLKYSQSIATHPSHTKRVKWPCSKCGKVFYGRSGLFIAVNHGTIEPTTHPTRDEGTSIKS